MEYDANRAKLRGHLKGSDEGVDRFAHELCAAADIDQVAAVDEGWPIPVDSDFSRKASTSASLGDLNRHIRGEDAKNCTASAPMSPALSMPLSSPPEVDTCAPILIHSLPGS